MNVRDSLVVVPRQKLLHATATSPGPVPLGVCPCCIPLPQLLDCARPLASVEIPVLNLSRRRNPAIRVAIPNQEIFKLLPAFVTQASLNL